MLFYIVDDDESTRAMLAEIIEDEDLGVVAGEAEDGSILDNHPSIMKKIDILLIDLLMPVKDGIETIQDLKSVFTGKTIMISQMESKELIEKAYSQGVTYFITKPINKIEVLSVIKNVIESIQLEKSIHNIYRLTENLLPEMPAGNSPGHDFITSAEFLLSEVGITGEKGYQDMLDILNFLCKYEREKTFKGGLPPLKDIYLKMIKDTRKISCQQELNREIKASEQRIRRAIYQSLTHFAAIGLDDFMNPTFEKYAPKFFDFEIVQRRMEEMKQNHPSSSPPIRVSTKKFILVLYFETKQILSGD